MSQKLNINEIEERKKQSSLQGTKLPIVVIAEDIRSLHNVGSIFRTSDGASISKLYLTGYTPTPPRPEIEKAALGSTESVEWEYVFDSAELVHNLKIQGYTIVALEQTDKSVSYREAEFSFPICLVIGNEKEGVSQKVIDLADMVVDLPMLGSKQSLNVSVAYGIMIYQLIDAFLCQTVS